MATQLIATGTGFAQSADFTVISGAPATLSLKGLSNPASVINCVLEIKDSDSNYSFVCRLGPVQVIRGPGTFRVTRNPTGVTYGVDVVTS